MAQAFIERMQRFKYPLAGFGIICTVAPGLMRLRWRCKCPSDFELVSMPSTDAARIATESLLEVMTYNFCYGLGVGATGAALLVALLQVIEAEGKYGLFKKHWYNLT